LTELLLLSDSKFYQKDLTSIINILIENEYPKRFIFDAINDRNIQRGGAAVHDHNNKNEESNVTTS